MDNLARNAMLAKQAGMSYGQWKALQPRVEYKKKPEEGMKKCPYCGNYFKPRKNNIYCDPYCQKRAQAERDRARKAAQYV